jgi:transcriptional regulator with XRE-family HTH domain
MRRRLTAKALSELTGLAADTISRLENGSNAPDETTVEKLARALGFPVEFFSDRDPEDINTDAVSVRSFSKMSAKERDAAISAGCLGLELSGWAEERFRLALRNFSREEFFSSAVKIFVPLFLVVRHLLRSGCP